MADERGKTVEDLVRHVGRFPEQAFLFVREGLSFAAQQIHGEETEAQRLLQQHLAANHLDWDEIAALYHAGELPDELMKTIEGAGGCDSLNRHVSGRDLCGALRDYALRRWGMLARAVLESWNIRSTSDFGAIVFGFIDLGLMQKQSEDRIEDFDDVFSFAEAFDEPYRGDGAPNP